MPDIALEASIPTDQDVYRIVKDAKQEWTAGSQPDACAVLDRHPSLLRRKSAVLDLAVEEFCRRRQAGENLDPNEFGDRFPAFRSAVRSYLRFTCWVAEHPDFIPSDTPGAWPEPGASFGEHTVVRELGRGTFARAFLATEASTGDRPVVLKLSLDDSLEARTQGRLAHENIVPVLYARRHESGFSIVCMPYFGSATLADVFDYAYAKDAQPPLRAQLLLEAVRAAVQLGDPVPSHDLPASLRPIFAKATWSRSHRPVRRARGPRGAGLRPQAGHFSSRPQAVEYIDRQRRTTAPARLQSFPGRTARRFARRWDAAVHGPGATPPLLAREPSERARGRPRRPVRAGRHLLRIVDRPASVRQDSGADRPRAVGPLATRTPARTSSSRSRSLNPAVSPAASGGSSKSCLAPEAKDRPENAAKLAAALRPTDGPTSPRLGAGGHAEPGRRAGRGLSGLPRARSKARSGDRQGPIPARPYCL